MTPPRVNVSPEARALADNVAQVLAEALVDVALPKRQLARALKARTAIRQIATAVRPLLEHIERLESDPVRKMLVPKISRALSHTDKNGLPVQLLVDRSGRAWISYGPDPGGESGIQLQRWLKAVSPDSPPAHILCDGPPTQRPV